MARRLLLYVLLLAAGAASCRREAPPAEASNDEASVAVPVAAEPARLGRLRALIHTTGVVTPSAGAEFVATSPEPARILEIPPAVGERVARGDLLVRFDMPTAAQEAARLQADVARAQALVENARVSQTRARELAERGIISRREMETVDREVADAQAELARAEAARRALEAAATRAIIRAPFAGIIAQRLRNPGDVTQGLATDPILRLVDPDRLEVTAPIPAADASRVLPGAAARVTSAAESTALVVAARPVASTIGGDAVARLTFAAGATMAVDTRVDIEIDGEEHVNAVLVPADAIVRTGGETAVMVAAGALAERRIVTTGLVNADSVEIVSGLEAGELVITRGQTGLADGAAITVDRPRP